MSNYRQLLWWCLLICLNLPCHCLALHSRVLLSSFMTKRIEAPQREIFGHMNSRVFKSYSWPLNSRNGDIWHCSPEMGIVLGSTFMENSSAMVILVKTSLDYLTVALIIAKTTLHPISINLQAFWNEMRLLPLFVPLS